LKITGAVLHELGLPRPYGTSAPVQLQELELAPPQIGEILVRIAAAGLCHSDLSVVDGNRPRPLPMALGHEAAGEVVEIGPGVEDIAVGDHVVLVYVASCGSCEFCSSGQPALCSRAAASNAAGTLLRGGRRLTDAKGEPVQHHLGLSAFSDYAVVDRRSVVAIDQDIPFDVASMFGCALLTGFGAVAHTAGVKPGESVVIFGLGGVGMAAVMAAVASGANPIIAVDPIAEKRELALSLGATHVSHPDEALALVRSVTAGGARWAFEVVGSAAVMQAAFEATGRGGTTVAVGLPKPGTELVLPALTVVAESRSLLGSYMGSAQPQRDIPTMIGLWRAGKLPVERLKSGEFGVAEINTALEGLAAGSALRQVLIPG
jgi:alcohol dehydrogenase